MALALIINVVLGTAVGTTILALLGWAIRSSAPAAPAMHAGVAAQPAAAHSQPQRLRPQPAPAYD
jgi:hypothetical protein